MAIETRTPQRITLDMSVDSAAHFQAALDWATARLARQRSRAAAADEHVRWLDWVAEERNLVYLQRQLGHGDLAVTTRYTAALNPDDVIAVSKERAAPQMAVPDLMGGLRG